MFFSAAAFVGLHLLICVNLTISLICEHKAKAKDCN